MTNAGAVYPILIRHIDLGKVANHYAAQLLLCSQRQTPTSYLHARAVHGHMIAFGFRPHGHILNRLIDVYCKASNLGYARHLFGNIPDPCVVARTTLISAYSASGHLKLAYDVFSKTPLSMRDTVCYNAMITAFSHNDDGLKAIKLFCDMRRDSFRPDNFTFTSVLAAVALVADRETQCQQLHCAVVKSGTDLFTSVLNSLISLYVKCASSPLVSPSSLMRAARKLFGEMPKRDELTWTAMITGYVRNGDLNAARQLLDGMTEKLEVSWNAMISGYVQHGFVSEALDLFRKMRLSGLQLDGFTYTSILSACADARLFYQGRELHAYIIRTEGKPTQDFSISVNNALVTLYWKCGKVREADRKSVV